MRLNRLAMDLIKLLEDQPKSFATLISLLVIAIIGLIDYYISAEVYVSILYLIPIGIGTWFADNCTGFLLSIISAIVSLLVNQSQDKFNLPVVTHYWNTIVILGFFLFTNYLLSSLKKTLRTLEKLAHTDNLTGLKNRMVFLDSVNNEIAKSKRYKDPLTVAYVDIDDFKKVNDLLGHNAGDRLLRSVADAARNTLRQIDVIARIGGDEFAILLPRTDYEASEVVLHRLQRVLLSSMEQQGLSITFSIGAITFSDPPHSVNEIIEKADNLMYSAKRKGKNLLQHELSGNIGSSQPTQNLGY